MGMDMTYSQSGASETTESKSYVEMVNKQWVKQGQKGNQVTVKEKDKENKYALDTQAGIAKQRMVA